MKDLIQHFFLNRKKIFIALLLLGLSFFFYMSLLFLFIQLKQRGLYLTFLNFLFEKSVRSTLFEITLMLSLFAIFLLSTSISVFKQKDHSFKLYLSLPFASLNLVYVYPILIWLIFIGTCVGVSLTIYKLLGGVIPVSFSFGLTIIIVECFCLFIFLSIVDTNKQRMRNFHFDEKICTILYGLWAFCITIFFEVKDLLTYQRTAIFNISCFFLYIIPTFWIAYHNWNDEEYMPLKKHLSFLLKFFLLQLCLLFVWAFYKDLLKSFF